MILGCKRHHIAAINAHHLANLSDGGLEEVIEIYYGKSFRADAVENRLARFVHLELALERKSVPHLVYRVKLMARLSPPSGFRSLISTGAPGGNSETGTFAMNAVPSSLCGLPGYEPLPTTITTPCSMPEPNTNNFCFLALYETSCRVGGVIVTSLVIAPSALSLPPPIT